MQIIALSLFGINWHKTVRDQLALTQLIAEAERLDKP
jgi:hypothetical protein